jgi:hypothetical protein
MAKTGGKRNPHLLAFKWTLSGDDYYSDSGYRVYYGKKFVTAEIGGWKAIPGLFGYNLADTPIWQCGFSIETSCCGFPVLTDISERALAKTYAKEIGLNLAKHLVEDCFYISAYVPNNGEYEATKLIFEAAGFRPGITLNSTHNEDETKPYTNTRWEWIAANAPKGMVNAKTLPPLAI